MKVSKLLLLSLVLLLQWARSESDEDIFGRKCRALVLEGGGDKGAYQAGAVRMMYEMLGKEAKYDVFSGVSAGSVNAISLSFFDKGQEDQATQFIGKLQNLTLILFIGVY